ncbi:MAG: recombination mediator RecR [Patescibacteria group bacterium]|uniref:Recombination protein RecR n=1 Tax=candidate division WWE3 bacterium TaxID=2053526 RepID=A0A955EDW8_UNCKA|nr:recombination protein RecR [candidate division WWE3 bacterium]
MKLPKPIINLIESFERLPGIGPKTAQRLTFHLLHFPEDELARFAKALVGLKRGTSLCSICKNVTDSEICDTCDDYSRDKNIIAVVAGPLDAYALEKAGYKGVYHVLHGLINPLNNVGPEDIFISKLLKRVEESSSPLELILATDTGMEGEATAMYISKQILALNYPENKINITRIARGLPAGGSIEYADDITLARALEGRRSL